jgi:tRNA(Ile)-lysidine synthase
VKPPVLGGFLFMPDKQPIEQMFTASLKAFLQGQGRDVVVAYSGGVDSHVLLHSLASVREQFPQHHYYAIYIHHGLSANADLWQRHCELSCKALNIEFKTAKVEVVKTSRQSLEANAREARYIQLNAMVADNSIILLGQHLDDQLETFLLQLKRGAGPKGLSAMPVLQESERNIQFIRPFLDISRQQILSYAQAHQLQWQEDESNQNVAFERNFLRQQVLPVINQRWPEFAQSVSRSAALCAEQQGLLDEVVEQRLADIKLAEDCLDINKLSQLSDAWLAQIVRYWLAQQQIISPSLAIMQRLGPDLLAAREDANPVLRWQNWQFRRFANKLYVLPLYGEMQDCQLSVSPQQRCLLPDGLGSLYLSSSANNASVAINFPEPTTSLQIKFGGFAVKFKPHGQVHSKPLKQWFKLWKIPPWQRERSALIYAQDTLLAVLCEGQLIAAEQVINENNLNLYLTFQRP